MKLEKGDEVELIGEYLWSSKKWPDYEKRIRAGGNHGVIVEAGAVKTGSYYEVRWDGLEDPLAMIMADAVRPYKGEPITQEELDEVMSRLAKGS